VQARFFGVRGSIPTTLTPEEVRRKIASVVQRVKPQDLESSDSRERFLSSLPEWLFGTAGGNTPCIDVRLDDGTRIILDAGSGIRELSYQEMSSLEKSTDFHIFFSHFHYDHIQGLPFFAPAYNPQCSITFYSPISGFMDQVKDHMRHPFFPITMDGKMGARLGFRELGSESLDFGTATVAWRELNHPGRAFAYRIEEAGQVFIYCTDVELLQADFEKTEENSAFFANADVLVLDTQYTLGEAIEKFDWGHSSFSLGVDFAVSWNVKNLYLFHHEPLYDDKRLHKNLQSARWYANRLGNSSLKVYLSREGEEIAI
jgi:phosphoribosyl 1,2-cyclic phosphodiesterase